MSSDFISLRKEQLRNQITELRGFEEEGQLLWLRSQLVHRYGIETLQDSYLYELECSTSSSLDKIETDYKFEESEITDQKNLFPEQARLEDNLPLNSSKQIKLDEKIFETSLEKDFNAISDQKIESSESVPKASPVISSPPPTPSLNHLRRWLPSIEDSSIPKAS